MVVRDGAARDGDAPGMHVKPVRKPVNGARKGAEFERDLAAYFVSLGYENARRMIRTGTAKHADEGDIDGLPFTVQAKDRTGQYPKGMPDSVVATVLEQARGQARAQGHLVGFAVEKVARQPVAHAWAHVDALSLAYAGCYDMPRGMGLARTLQGAPVRLRLGRLMTILAWKYPPE